jgi:hypothetical protein
MSFQWNVLAQKLFWWKNTNTDPVVGNYSDTEDQKLRKVNLAIINTHKNLKKFYKEIDVLKEFYMSKLMIGRIIDDALNPTAEGDEIFKITINNNDGTVNELATKEARQLKRNLNIERLIVDIAPDILAYGSHYLRIDVNTINSENVLKGIMNIHDDVDPASIIPVWRDNEIIYYNVIKDGKIERVNAYEYVFFGFSTERTKVEIELNDDQAIYFRVGTGLLKPVIHLLRTLYLLEGLVYVNLIKKVSKQPILSVTVPETMTPEKAIDVAKSYEKLINKNLNNVKIDFENIQETLEQILENTSQVKVIPDWGSKGQIQKQDLEVYAELDEIYEKITDLRNVILQTNGFPSSLFENDSTQRIDIIQNSVRYTKKLKSFQQALKNGLKHLFLIHLKNQNFDISMFNIDIQFTNVINVSDLEKIEYLSLVIDTMSTIKDFINEIAEESEELGINVNKRSLIKFYNKAFKKLFTDEDIFLFEKGNNNEIQK